MPVTNEARLHNFAGNHGNQVWSAMRRTWRLAHGDAVKRAYLDEGKSVPQIREEIFKRSVCEPTIYNLLRSLGVKIRTAPSYPITDKQRAARSRNIAGFNARQ